MDPVVEIVEDDVITQQRRPAALHIEPMSGALPVGLLPAVVIRDVAVELDIGRVLIVVEPVAAVVHDEVDVLRVIGVVDHHVRPVAERAVRVRAHELEVPPLRPLSLDGERVAGARAARRHRRHVERGPLTRVLAKHDRLARHAGDGRLEFSAVCAAVQPDRIARLDLARGAAQRVVERPRVTRSAGVAGAAGGRHMPSRVRTRRRRWRPVRLRVRRRQRWTGSGGFLGRARHHSASKQQHRRQGSQGLEESLSEEHCTAPLLKPLELAVPP